MEITDIRIKLAAEKVGRLKAFVSVVFDDQFIVHDIKIIEGRGRPGAPPEMFLSMPSHQIADRCPSCDCKNHLRARYCSDCGRPLNPARAYASLQPGELVRWRIDMANPLDREFRQRLTQTVLDSYQNELRLATMPGYKSRYPEGIENKVG